MLEDLTPHSAQYDQSPISHSMAQYYSCLKSLCFHHRGLTINLACHQNDTHTDFIIYECTYTMSMTINHKTNPQISWCLIPPHSTLKKTKLYHYLFIFFTRRTLVWAVIKVFVNNSQPWNGSTDYNQTYTRKTNKAANKVTEGKHKPVFTYNHSQVKTWLLFH